MQQFLVIEKITIRSLVLSPSPSLLPSCFGISHFPQIRYLFLAPTVIRDFNTHPDWRCIRAEESLKVCCSSEKEPDWGCLSQLHLTCSNLWSL